MGELFLGMMGQMLREERTISQVGPQGRKLMQVHPLDLQGDFDVNVNVMDESHRPPGEAIRGDGADEHASPTVGPAMAGLNMKPVMEKVLESYGIENTEEFFPPPPPAGVALLRVRLRAGRLRCARDCSRA